jgi:hypothetical protein
VGIGVYLCEVYSILESLKVFYNLCCANLKNEGEGRRDGKRESCDSELVRGEEGRMEQ